MEGSRLCTFISMTHTFWDRADFQFTLLRFSMEACEYCEYVIDNTKSRGNYSFCNWNWRLLLDIFQQQNIEHDS